MSIDNNELTFSEYDIHSSMLINSLITKVKAKTNNEINEDDKNIIRAAL